MIFANLSAPDLIAGRRSPRRDCLKDTPARPAEDISSKMSFTFESGLERSAMKPSQCTQFGERDAGAGEMTHPPPWDGVGAA